MVAAGGCGNLGRRTERRERLPREARTRFAALDTAHGGAVEEGNVGGGTGMICNEFKGGIGTSSRVMNAKHGGYTVGVLVQCNYGQRDQLRIAGVPVGKEIAERTVRKDDVGSIIVVVATDAPLIPTQLKRLAPQSLARSWAGREFLGGRIRRHLHRLFDGESWRRKSERRARSEDAAE